ncbi:MAG: hypothetical protein ACI8WB_001457 [Phenylobacterium sp.]|jgi:hypothetical protein
MTGWFVFGVVAFFVGTMVWLGIDVIIRANKP